MQILYNAYWRNSIEILWEIALVMCLMSSPTREARLEFAEAFDRTMEWEGGGNLHSVPGDPGGLTKWGVSQRAHPELDIANLTKEEAMQIAREDYYEAVGGDALPPGVRWHVFDMAYNAGVQRASMQLQKAVNLYHLTLGRDFLHVDGRVGPRTLEAVGRLQQDKLVRLFQHERRTHYVRLAMGDRSKFLHGWLRRVDA